MVPLAMISTQNWQNILQLFRQVIELPAAERKSFLEQHCGNDELLRLEVEKLIRADEESDDFLEASPVHSLTRLPTIKNYELLREIGHGGMGKVYEALRSAEDVSQKVALKIIQGGMSSADLLRRFRTERRILASLEHPNIARLIDSGITDDGSPFFAMEFVEGKFIDEYCEGRDLSTTEILKHFRQVCAAVSYAHQHLVIHRDLKPTNILVTTDGSPKLLDFGIAKLLEDSDEDVTVTAFGLMTPQYASPEQARGGQITTASDVYSLGVVLYEILTKEKPYDLKDKRPDEITKAICETQPLKPSLRTTKTRNALNADLDNIVLKALQKEPARRYLSVEQFSEDIRRYLEGLPVAARPDTFTYRASKYFARNKTLVMAASLLTLTLAAGVIATAWQAKIARTERRLAEQRFEEVRKLANNVVFKYHDEIANLPGSIAVRKTLVGDAVQYLDRLSQDASNNDALNLELAQSYLKIGDIQGAPYIANLGESENALVSYQKCVALLEKLVAKNPGDNNYLVKLKEAYEAHELLQVRVENWEAAENAANRGLQVALKLVSLNPEKIEFKKELARSYVNIGDAVDFSQGYEGKLQMYRKALQIADEINKSSPANEKYSQLMVVVLQRLGTRLEDYGESLREQNKDALPTFVEAVQHHRRSLEIAEQLVRDFPAKNNFKRYLPATRMNVGSALARSGKAQESIQYFQLALEGMKTFAVSDQKNIEARRDVAEALQYLAIGYDKWNKPGEAKKYYREALAMLEQLSVNDPNNFEFLSQTFEIYKSLGDLSLNNKNVPEAIHNYEQGLSFIEKMSQLNKSSSIIVLRSDSNRKLGYAYKMLKGNEKLAAGFMKKAQDDLLYLQKNKLLKQTDKYKLDLVQVVR